MPRQLHTIDRLFLDLETEQYTMGVSPVYFYDPSGMENGEFNLATVTAHLDQVARSIPVFCGKLHRTTMDLDNPYLVEEKRFDINRHVHHHAMREPTSIKELTKVLNNFQAGTMNTEIPLWEVLVVSGINVKTLPENAFALLVKIHHTIADGTTMMNITDKLHKSSGSSALKPVQWPSESKLKSGGPIGTWFRVVENNLKNTAKLFRPMVSVAPKVSLKALNMVMESIWQDKRPVAKTRFADEIQGDRTWSYNRFELAQIKRLQKLVPGVTLNHVVLAIITGGLREYFLDKNELPNGAFRIMAPINVRSEQEYTVPGNEIAMMSIELPIHLDDPVEQLVAVGRNARHTMDEVDKMGARTLSEMVKHIPPAYLSAVFSVMGPKVGYKLIEKLGNVTVTNVRGPTKPLFMQGAELVTMSGITPIVPSMGMITAVISYAGQLNVAATSCEAIIPDPKFYSQCMERSYQRLGTALEQHIKSLSTAKSPAAKVDAVKNRKLEKAS